MNTHRRYSCPPFVLCLLALTGVISAAEFDIGSPEDESVIGEGFWRREGPNPESKLPLAKGGTFRWTDNVFALRLPAEPGRPSKVRWRARVPGPVIVRAGDWRTVLYSGSPDDLDLEFFVPAGLAGEDSTLVLTVSAVVPRRLSPESRDKRTLFAMFDKVSIEAVDKMPDAQVPPVASDPPIPPLDRIRGIETRPPSADPAAYTAVLEARGANIVTMGTMNGRGYVFHPTKFGIPYPEMVPDYIPTVTGALRSQGFGVLNWVVFNIQDTHRVEDFALAREYPQWTMKFIPDPDQPDRPATGMCLLSSPYIERHANLLRESAEFGFDGFFFDGFYFAGVPDRTRAGCVCDFCRDAFKTGAGLDLPARVDWNDRTFKRWVRWRNERLLGTARRFQDAIQEVSPTTAVTFNYNLWPFGNKNWETAIPMWRIRDFGVSQHGYAGPFSQKWMMLGFKCRLGRDINPAHTDVWRTGKGSSCWGAGDPDYEWSQLEMTTFELAGLSHGIVPWHGSCAGPPAVGAAVHAAAAKREQFFSRKHIARTAVLASENTLQFWGHREDGRNHLEYRDSLIGSWMLLSENHVSFEFLFDNQIAAEELARYTTLVLPSAAALSRKDAETLAKWVEKGGRLITTGPAGSFDEWGEPHGESLLRSVFDLDPAKAADKKLGQGKITHFPSDPGLLWARQRDKTAPKLVEAILEQPQPFTVEAPNWVCAELFENPKDERERWVHLLNVSHLMPGGDSGFRGLENDPVETRPAELVIKGRTVGPPLTPAKNIRIGLEGPPPKSARLAVSGQELSIDAEGWITIPELALHDVLVAR